MFETLKPCMRDDQGLKLFPIVECAKLRALRALVPHVTYEPSCLRALRALVPCDLSRLL